MTEHTRPPVHEHDTFLLGDLPVHRWGFDTLASPAPDAGRVIRRRHGTLRLNGGDGKQSGGPATANQSG